MATIPERELYTDILNARLTDWEYSNAPELLHKYSVYLAELQYAFPVIVM